MTRRIFRDLPGFIDAGKGCPAHIGTRDLHIHHPRQDGVQVQILGDAEAAWLSRERRSRRAVISASRWSDGFKKSPLWLVGSPSRQSRPVGLWVHWGN